MLRKTIVALGLSLSVLAFGPAAQAGKKLSPEHVPGAVTIDAAKAKSLFDRGVVFVDPRRDSDWEAGRIPGAVHLELHSQFTEEALEQVVPKDAPVVFYCNGIYCGRSAKCAQKAVAWGWKQVYYFRGGFPEWQKAGYPVE